MPALPPVPGVVRLTHQFKIAADLDVLNVYHQQYSGTPGTLSDTGALAWVTAAANGFSTHVMPHMRSDVTLTLSTIEDLTSDTGAQAQFASAGTGSENVSALTAGTALVVRCRIERRYRGGHPRQYIAGIDGSHLATDQTWDPTFTGTFLTAYEAFRTAAAAGCPVGIGPAVDVNVSYYHGFTNHTYPSGRTRPIPTLRGTPLVDVISSFSINPKVASQRRRNLQSA